MSLIQINFKPSNRELRQFAGIWLPALLALAAFWTWQASGSLWYAAAVFAPALPLGVIGLLAPRAIRPVFVALSCLTFPIGWVISHVILAITYYGVITPLGLMMRLFGYDSMHRKLDRDAKSYWNQREAPADKRRYFRQF